jgi:nucleotide-binding universal stress UspA family protein
MIKAMSPHVLVGIDDTPDGAAALRAGAALADSLARPLRLVRVWREVDWFLSAPASATDGVAEDEGRDRELLTRASATAHSLAPDTELSVVFAPGSVYSVLLDLSREAAVLVLGAGRYDHPGSLSRWFAERATCPVLVLDSTDRVVLATPGAGAVLPAAG